MSAPPPDKRTGVACALAAHGLWGALPLYWKLLVGVPALEILLHRTVWSALFLGALVLALRRGTPLLATLRDRRRLGPLFATALLLGLNWFIYIYAILVGRTLEASLGYYINPLVMVLLGMAILGERLSPLQGVAVAIAGLGVATFALGLGIAPWISLGLALTFGVYGLVRKTLPVDSVLGLTVESIVLSPLALAALAWWWTAEGRAFGDGTPATVVLLALSGVATAVPLMLFTAAARRLRYVTMGLMQYIAPTITLLIAVAVFGERVTGFHLFAFACIWGALALYTADLVRAARRARAAVA